MLYQLFQTFSHHSYTLYLTRYIHYQMRKKKFCIKISKKINIYQNCSRKIAVLSARTCMMSSMLEIPAQVCNLIAYSCVVLNSKFMHNFRASFKTMYSHCIEILKLLQVHVCHGRQNKIRLHLLSDRNSNKLLPTKTHVCK